MAFPVPTNLSPSRVEAFTSCPLAFRFASIDRLPEPPSIHTTKGSLVHRALELLFADDRRAAARPTPAWRPWPRPSTELRASAELAPARLDADAEAAFFADAERWSGATSPWKTRSAVRDIGVELRLEVEVGGLHLRGIIDRLELDDDGGLVVTDYKTGRPPMVEREQHRLGGVHFYAFLCEQVFGRRPARIQLLYLSTGEIIETHPTEQSIRFLPRRTAAV